MKAFGNFRINTKPNIQSEGQAEQEDEGQIVSPTFQCSFFEMVLLFFFLLVCEILSPVCPPKIFFKNLHIDIQHFIQHKYRLRGKITFCVGK